jgi:hypothetical protein
MNANHCAENGHTCAIMQALQQYIPPHIPPVNTGGSEAQNFDDTLLNMEPVINNDGDEIRC